MKYLKGDIILVDLPKTEGSVQHGKRPCIVVSNNLCNSYSSILTVVPCTTKVKKKMPTHIKLNILGVENTVLCEQIITISVDQIIDLEIFDHAYVDASYMRGIDNRLRIALGLEVR